MNIYDTLCYKTDTKTLKYNWFGNDRWFVRQDNSGKEYSFCTTPVNRASGDKGIPENILKKTLFYIHTCTKTTQFTYGPDYLKSDLFSIRLPYHEYGASIQSNSSLCVSLCIDEGSLCEKLQIDNDTVTVHDGIYFIIFKTSGNISLSDKGFTLNPVGVKPFDTAVSFYIDKEKALNICKDMFSNSDFKQQQSKEFWEEYLQSCPVDDSIEDFEYHNDFADLTYKFSGRDIKRRQYWHWWCLLINVSNVEFNDLPCYMAPDRTGWLGTWSNDGPECMAALSLTNQKNIAREIIVSYIRTAITPDGIHSWYTNADGIGCYGRENDSGRASNGVPCIVHTVGFYVKNTGDKTILDEKVSSGQSVYERLKNYVKRIHADRDINNDGLIEWANLWESGWDDKLGCFFQGATLGEWWSSALSLNHEEFKRFVDINRYPVTTIVEQVYMLWALDAMSYLARIKDDTKLDCYCCEKALRIKSVISEKCWNEDDGFYHDINVNEQKQIKAKSTDCFYYLYFETNNERRKRIYSHLINSEEFNLLYVPMQSMDVEGFSPTGYWSGGHWPREMSYLAMGLDKSGYAKKAKEILCRAIMSGEGNNVYEVLNPLTGVPTTGISKMAYNIMDVIALLTVNKNIDWTLN